MKRCDTLSILFLWWWSNLGTIQGFQSATLVTRFRISSTLSPLKKTPATTTPSSSILQSPSNNDEKFGFAQRIDSVKSLVVGAVVGSFAVAIPEVIHQVILAPLWHLPTNAGLAQFEFDTDMAGALSGLFAIVYRYGLRQDTSNPQLNQGLIGAFVITRTLSRVTLPSYCTAIVLNCGPPLGYLDWNVLLQLGVNGVESVIMYAATAKAMDVCMERGYISRFPG